MVASPQPVRILIADDQCLFAEALKHLLTVHGFEVVGTAHDGLEAVVKARSLRPDVILMDIHMPGHDGLEATRRIKRELPGIRVVMLTVSAEDEDLFEALKSGASGYLLKNLGSEQLCDMLSGAIQGEPPLARGLLSRVLQDYARTATRLAQFGQEDDPHLDGLTLRQREVLAMVAQGLTYKEVGAALHLSQNTVKYHMIEILARLGLTRRMEAIAYAERAGLVRVPRPDSDLRLAS